MVSRLSIHWFDRYTFSEITTKLTTYQCQLPSRKKPVVPGDSLVMEAEIVKFNAKFGLAKAKAKAYVDGEVAVEVGEMTFALART